MLRFTRNKVVGVVRGLDALEALEPRPVRVGGSARIVLGHLEVDVVAAGREGPDLHQTFADRCRDLVAIRVRGPDAGEPTDEPGVAIPNCAVVVVVFVQCTREVEDDGKRQRRSDPHRGVAERVQVLARQAGEETRSSSNWFCSTKCLQRFATSPEEFVDQQAG
jgi:hypothetical protein